jgi:CubicO group peptidase (beta-lactamase class C family)
VTVRQAARLFLSAGGGLSSTAEDYLRFVLMLAGERRRRRIGDLERAVLQPGRRGRRQAQHPGRGAAEQDHAAVHHERLPVEDDPHPVRQRLLHGPEPRP